MAKSKMNDEIRLQMQKLGAAARAATEVLAQASTKAKNTALLAAAAALRADKAAILDANSKDVAETKNTGSATPAFFDRLQLDEANVLRSLVVLVAILPEDSNGTFR